MRSFATAGFAAGPCLLKDTLQLSTFSANNFFLGHAAMLINEGLPNFILNQLRSRDLRTKRLRFLAWPLSESPMTSGTACRTS